ncbi:helix-turn-helix protein [Haloactinospora alba]|uniref:Helix-turn-helix protein n=1 Tax=Haloactinospora alba TaxID=405555 RepID=A0A543NFI9_9ACTN|nr:helix-turn-helix domain-containing protein [Haloactinospora alba]TQN30577.1 helix-turn-helix protein [Haloactinospora alba]
MTWVEHAACQSVEYSPHWWDDETPEDRAEAIPVCWNECSVREQCLETGLQQPEHGIWGGYTRRQREMILRGCEPQQPAPPRQREMTTCDACGRTIDQARLRDAKCHVCDENTRRAAAAEQRLQRFRELDELHLTNTQIARELGVHPSTVSKYAAATRDPDDLTDRQTRRRRARAARAHDLATQGLPVREIAAELGISPQTVRTYL